MAFLRRTKNRKKKQPKDKYKSGLERQLHQGPLKAMDYEPCRLIYTTEHYYTPDFVPSWDKKRIFEAKGRFRDYREAQKYVDIKKSNPDIQLIFIFQNPHQKAYPQCKKREDGSMFTMAEWADKHGFLWCTPHTIKKEWLK